MLDNYKGFKASLAPRLNTKTKAGIRHVWDAMTGKYFTGTGLIGAGLTAVNE